MAHAFTQDLKSAASRADRRDHGKLIDLDMPAVIWRGAFSMQETLTMHIDAQGEASRL